ncbi:thymidine phosphorylase [Bythopirellula polymerisocia]|uniref:thymidine phosphorylase n=1 Tax=Bythopirellula polymerisocia TaxID=2528003 RepID=A0A5C6CPS5_9BACT|nr:thymidine phosphorylase [Bythopirellula polymerisocia]TWU25597.1 Pyrimidine-nucleoside phosphorylase [Bythopirellula polymerisocia]
MNPVWIIAKKRDGGELTAAEIGEFVAGYARGDVPDYQMSAMAMAIYLQGMTTAEIAALTDNMLASGARFEWPAGGLPKVDKHSTGGIGDKVSLPLAPMLACCDLQVPMISGRGLGATGGTLDKLEAIPGFRTDLSMDEMRAVVKKIGCVISGATADLVPADRKLYALRDVTATVPSIPLITGSIMSKKLAEGLDALVLDVKFGSGAFMKTAELARELAESMVATGQRMNVQTTAVLTDMNQPLGRMVGNAVEVDESVAALEGNGPDDLMEVTLALGAELLVSTKKSASIESAREQLQQTIDSGAAREKFAQMVTAQGGNLDAPRKVSPTSDVPASRSGYIAAMDTEKLGQAVIAMRGGRKQLGDVLDLSTGFEMLVRLGEKVNTGDPLAKLFAPAGVAADGRELFLSAIQISDEPPEVGPLILERVG